MVAKDQIGLLIPKHKSAHIGVYKMGAFRKVEANFNAAEILEAVFHNHGVLASFGFGFDCPSSITRKVGDWEVRLTNTRGMGNAGNYVVVPTTKATYQVALEATIRYLRRLADEAAIDETNWNWSRWTVELGGGHLIPILMSQFAPKGLRIGQDDRWQYFSHSEENFLNVGKTTRRVWVRPV